MKGFRSFAVSETGITHKKKTPPTPCQDSSACYDDDNLSVVVVADGHGDSSCFRSDRGSKFAVYSAMEGIKAFVNLDKTKDLFKEDEPPPKDVFDKYIRENLLNSVVASWIAIVHDDFAKKTFPDEKLLILKELFFNDEIPKGPFSNEELFKVESEKYKKRYADAVQLFNGTKASDDGPQFSQYITKAYGTSLLAAAITPDYWFGFHIGDGRWTVLYKKGKGDQPVPWDKRCFFNVTTSICDDDILDRKDGDGIRLFFSFNKDNDNEENGPPVAFYICSDGIDDNYSADEKKNRDELCRIYRTISLAFADDIFESACEQVKELIRIRWANAGKGDDTSLGIIINIDQMKEVSAVWKVEIEKAEKKREAEKAAEAEKARLEREEEKTNAEKDTAKKAEVGAKDALTVAETTTKESINAKATPEKDHEKDMVATKAAVEGPLQLLCLLKPKP